MCECVCACKGRAGRLDCLSFNSDKGRVGGKILKDIHVCVCVSIPCPVGLSVFCEYCKVSWCLVMVDRCSEVMP